MPSSIETNEIGLFMPFNVSIYLPDKPTLPSIARLNQDADQIEYFLDMTEF